MAFFLETLLGGLMSGMLYSLVALGFVAIFAVREIVNLVQGEYAALAGLAAISAVGAGLPLLVAIVCVIPLVVGVAVLVINFAARPSSMEEQPCEAMRKVQLPIYGDETVAIAVDASSGPVLRRSLAFTKPSEFAGPWAVIKKIAQALRGKIGLSHDAVLSLIGQRPGSVSALSGLRYFSTGVM